VIVRIFVLINLHATLIFSASCYITSFHIRQISCMIQRRIIKTELSLYTNCLFFCQKL